MAGRWASGSIAGIPLQDIAGRDIRADVLDGESLNATLFASTVMALDYSIHTQVAVNNKKGIHFGVHLALLPIDTYQSIIAAMESALIASSTFNVTLADDGTDKADDIDLDCVPDFAANNGKIAVRGPLSNVYVKDVVFRFIST